MTEANDVAFEQLLSEYTPALERLARSYAFNANDVEDLLQEIAFALWRATGGFRGECNVRTFVYRIAHNRALSWRARHRHDAVPAEVPLDAEDPRATPDQLAVRADRRQRLQTAVAALPERLRTVVVLRLEGLCDREIADVVGITEGNVAVRLTRARKVLREKLGEDRP